MEYCNHQRGDKRTLLRELIVSAINFDSFSHLAFISPRQLATKNIANRFLSQLQQPRIGAHKSAANLVIAKKLGWLEKRLPATKVGWLQFLAGPRTTANSPFSPLPISADWTRGRGQPLLTRPPLVSGPAEPANCGRPAAAQAFFKIGRIPKPLNVADALLKT